MLASMDHLAEWSLPPDRISGAISGIRGVKMNTTRRDFLKVSAGAVAATSGVSANSKELASSTASGERTAAPAGQAGDMIYRKFGSTDAQISAIGVGGHHLGDVPTLDEAVQLVHEAIDAGVTFFDNAWEYYNGKTETILGRALRDGRREKVFLMTKVCTHGRSGKLAMQMLEDSLRRYQTEHLDLWQIHGIVDDNDPELAYAKGGVLEAFDRAKKEGKVRFVGFTGHKDPGFHLRMLELGYPFDSVQMPLNPFDANFHSFEKQVLPEVNRRGMAALGMKSMGGTAWGIKAGVLQAEEMLRYAMSLPVATTICGMDSLDVLHQNLSVVRNFQPMAQSEMEALRARCAPAAADGRFEPYKVSLRYDNPIALSSSALPHEPSRSRL